MATKPTDSELEMLRNYRRLPESVRETIAALIRDLVNVSDQR